MIEPQEIADRCAEMFETTRLTGKKVLITGGPTREAIDPVRFMQPQPGKWLLFAAEVAAAGAQVSLVSGPVHCPHLTGPHRSESADRCSKRSWGEWLTQISSSGWQRSQIIGRPQLKRKKSRADSMTLALVKNPDIISRVAALSDGPMVVGFAAELNISRQMAQRSSSARA